MSSKKMRVLWIGLLVAVARTKGLQNCTVDVIPVTVGSTGDAAELASFLECSTGQFAVQWVGKVFVAEAIHVKNGTSLNITGTGSGAIADGQNTAQLFKVDGVSRLHLSDMTLAHGNAFFGGAIFANQSSVSFSGNTSFTFNSAEEGGAIYAVDSSVSWNGYGTQFSSNSAETYGGVITAYNSNVSWNGDDTQFSNNSAEEGGAIGALDSNVSWNGDDTQFSNNFAGLFGGAIFAFDYSSVSWNGDGTQFSNNSAGNEGGAISAWFSSVSWNGDGTQFSNNFAEEGGAIGASYSSVSWNGNGTQFSNNSAGRIGGAIEAFYSSVSWNGDGTQFSNNFAGPFGGAINAYQSSVSWNGDGTQFSNNFAEEGGAISAYNSSNVSWNGNGTQFSNNSAGLGGAIDASWDASVSWNGDDTQFSNNFAQNGGAISAYLSSNVSWNGYGTQFSNNSAGYSGGAIDASWDSSVSWNGDDTQFSNNSAFSKNSAETPGGAIYAYQSSVSWNGDHAQFSNNSAGYDGGAIYAFDSSVSWNGYGTQFSNNSAGRIGGAISAYGSSSVSWNGDGTQFSNNSAESSGGAIAMDNSEIFVEGAKFSHNRAINGAGGGLYCSSSVISFNRSVFEANEAVWGGAVALFSSGSEEDEYSTYSLYSSGSVEDEYSSVDEGPSVLAMCVFESNRAVDGGALYSTAGYDIIKDSWFENNLAENGSGGAYLYSGVLVELSNTTFVRNRASDFGLAVQSLGILGYISDTTFESDTYYCAKGLYGYDISESEEEVLDTCRFDKVCSGCAPSCNEIPESVNVLDDTGPTCQAVMSGVDTSGNGGMTLSTLNLKRGYYRTSNESHEILECHREDACTGGVETSLYCKEGYKGPYCAVCEDGYASGYQYSCSSCENKQSDIGTSIALFLVALIVIALVIAELVQVVEESNTDTPSVWRKRLTSCRDRIANAVPLTSIKIVVVAWQIITQFSSVANVVYPDVYQEFISALNLVNFNFSFIKSVSCVIGTNFYGWLFVATIGPLVVLGALAATYAVSRSRNRHSPVGMQAAKSKHLSIALFFVFILYSSVSFTIFQTFNCEELDDGKKYLRADYSLECTTGTHTAMMVYAGLMVLVYPIGIPTVFAWWLVSNRHDLLQVGAPGTTSEGAKTLDHLQPMRDLWAPYKPNRYYFEVVECGRRIALTGLAAFLVADSAAQAALEVVLAAVFVQVSAKLSPFVDPLDEWLYSVGTWIIFFNMFLALLLKVDVSHEDAVSQKVFAGLLIAAHVGMISMVMVQAVLSVRRGLVTMRDQPAANRSFRGPNFSEGRPGKTGAVVTGESEPQWSKEIDEAAERAPIQG